MLQVEYESGHVQLAHAPIRGQTKSLGAVLAPVPFGAAALVQVAALCVPISGDLSPHLRTALYRARCLSFIQGTGCSCTTSRRARVLGASGEMHTACFRAGSQRRKRHAERHAVAPNSRSHGECQSLHHRR